MLKASIVVPCRNRRQQIAAQLSYLMQQSASPATFELIVVDDGSNDGTQEFIKAFRSPFHLNLVVSGDGNQPFNRSKVRNYGIRAAQNDIVILLDSDVMPGPDLVQKHIETHLQADKHVAVIGYCYGYPADPQKRTPEHLNPPDIEDIVAELPDLIKARADDWRDCREVHYQHFPNLHGYPDPWQLFWTCNVSARRESLLSVGGFDETFVGWGGEDLELGYRLIKNNITMVPGIDAWGVHYPHPVSPTYNTDVAQSTQKIIQIHPDFDVEYSLWISRLFIKYKDDSTVWEMYRDLEKCLRKAETNRESISPKQTRSILEHLGIQEHDKLLWFGRPSKSTEQEHSYPAFSDPWRDEVSLDLKTTFQYFGTKTHFEDQSWEYTIHSNGWNLLDKPFIEDVVAEQARICQRSSFFIAKRTPNALEFEPLFLHGISA